MCSYIDSLVLELWDRVYLACYVAGDVLGKSDPALRIIVISLNFDILVDEVYDDLQLL